MTCKLNISCGKTTFDRQRSEVVYRNRTVFSGAKWKDETPNPIRISATSLTGSHLFLGGKLPQQCWSTFQYYKRMDTRMSLYHRLPAFHKEATLGVPWLAFAKAPPFYPTTSLTFSHSAMGRLVLKRKNLGVRGKRSAVTSCEQQAFCGGNCSLLDFLFILCHLLVSFVLCPSAARSYISAAKTCCIYIYIL